MARGRRCEATGTCRECGRVWAVARGGRVRAAHGAGFCSSSCLDARVGRMTVTDAAEMARVEAEARAVEARDAAVAGTDR